MKKDFVIIIKYKNKFLKYVSLKDSLILENDNNINIELMKNRAIEILDKDLWNMKDFCDKFN